MIGNSEAISLGVVIWPVQGKGTIWMNHRAGGKVWLWLAGLAFLFAGSYQLGFFIRNVQEACNDKAIETSILQYDQDGSNSSFVVNHWPAEDEKLATGCYYLNRNVFATRRGVGIGLETHNIAEYEVITPQSNTVQASFVDRVSLQVDGKEVSNSSRVVMDNIVEIFLIKDGQQIPTGISSGYRLSWTPFLLPGSHNARITIATKSGEILEFVWNFTIIGF